MDSLMPGINSYYIMSIDIYKIGQLFHLYVNKSYIS